jgi:hypothetical protein
LELMLYVRTPNNKQQSYAVDQPVQFDHRHHVRDDGIDCQYCHTTVDRSSTAGIPSTEVCMGCHAQIWHQSDKLALVRDSFFRDEPIKWNVVHDLPDFVYFNHSVHIHAGIDCSHCHGDVASMPLVHKVRALTMGFCLDCHRNPQAYVPHFRPTSPTRHPLFEQGIESHPTVITNPLITCTACHR